MVNKEQVYNGIIRYVDNEILPNLPTYGKWLFGGYIVLIADKFDRIYTQLIQSPMISPLEVSTPDGMLDVGKLADALRISADKYGKISLTFPGLQPMYFTKDDITMLEQYITGVR